MELLDFQLDKIKVNEGFVFWHIEFEENSLRFRNGKGEPLYCKRNQISVQKEDFKESNLFTDELFVMRVDDGSGLIVTPHLRHLMSECNRFRMLIKGLIEQEKTPEKTPERTPTNVTAEELAGIMESIEEMNAKHYYAAAVDVALDNQDLATLEKLAKQGDLYDGND